ncbi:MAG: NAD(P)/FAD-dependent oxidoreductase [Candidatus Riflebacteria bacterium]|nr:NAD(P)/FAD-dependent oxidoreductase [Candidatus Riflebacteria bacterium]
MDKIDITIGGGGVIGLAVAYLLSLHLPDRSILLIEKNHKYGQETSSHNSEVIHSGIYYPKDSLKARLCVEGLRALYDFCKKFQIPYRRTGKLIVALDNSEIPALENFYQKGISNNAPDLEIIGRNEVRKLEPCVKGIAAIYSPSTGIIDSHSLMSCFHNQAKMRNVMFVFGREINYLNKSPEGYTVGVTGEDFKILSRVFINASGLGTDYIQNLLGIDPLKNNSKLRLCKGSYFSYQGKSPVNMLVYPLPHEGLSGLGVHATVDLSGRLRFGPDVEFVDSVNYNVDVGKAVNFFNSAAKMIDGLELHRFQPDLAGIRPKLCGTGIRDFMIIHEAASGLEGFINLTGIESPGLTSCLSIAEMVRKMVYEYLF